MSFEKMYIVWICAGIIFGVLEAVTVQLVSVWFVIGSCAALVSSLLGAKLYVQIIVFIVTSVLMLLITRPIVKKKLTVKVEPTNADRCIGLIATVIEDINNIDGTGLVKVDGKIWTARSSDSSIIEKGTKVIIEKIDGVKLIVKKEQHILIYKIEKEKIMKLVIVFLVIIAVFILFVLTNIRIVPQSKAFVIERLGAYFATWETGLHVKVPFIDRIAKTVSLKEQVVDFKPQPVITKDNVTMQIDTVVFFQITDPKLYCYGVENPISAIENLSATTLRNIIGELELDSTLTSRDTINAKIRVILDEATDPWGIKVNRVELKNIIPPREIQDAMEKQMKAERERREAILRAEGEKQSRILVAEGHKESKILEAQADKQSAILAAEAEKEAKIREAEGEAEAIAKVQKATADAIKMLNEADANESVLKLKALEAFAKAADGQATKIIIPSEIQGIAGLAEGIIESVKK